jgi:hypothetical protein
MAAIDTIVSSVTNAPLSLMIEKMGISIATAQAALDHNSIAMLMELADTNVTIGTNETNLLALGFVPSFYAFTEASFEAKMEFSMAESTEFSIGGSVDADFGVLAVSVNASYARKFEQSASGSSSISARMVSLPPPENLLALLKSLQPTSTT